MKKLINKFLIYFRRVKLYESKKKPVQKINNPYKLYLFKRFNKIGNKSILNYFKKFKEKKIRFSNKQHFLVLILNKKLVCSGWMSESKFWKITEINYVIKIKRATMLFDFNTPFEARSKGYYTQILKMILTKFKSKKFMIYALSSNQASIQGISKAGFVLKKNLTHFSRNDGK